MKSQLKRILSSICMLLASTCTVVWAADTDQNNQQFGHTFFAQRPQVMDLADHRVGVTPYFLVVCDSDCLNGYISLKPEFTRNFDTDKIGKYFFFNGTNTMSFGNASTTIDVFGRNFFLNDNFSGTLTARPRYENFLLDIGFRLNLDEWLGGLYFELNAPINWTRWAMTFTQNVVSPGTTIAANTFGNGSAAGSPVTSIIQAFNGQTLNTTTFPDLKQTLQFGRVDDSNSNGRKSKTGVADVTAAIGYNFWCCDSYHLGFDIRGLFPTGNRPDSTFLFEPVVGSGKHFGLGGGVSGHYEFWNNCHDSSFSVWIEGDFYHFFKARQRRLFDLKNSDGTQRVGSNRLLIKRFNPGNVFADEILFGPNVLTREVKVSNAITGNALILFDYKRCGFTFDFGYEFWVRTKDKLSNIEPFPANTYGLLGNTGGSTSPDKDKTASQTQIDGTNAAADTTNVYLTVDSLFVGSAAHPTAMSHKAFAHASYAWEHCDYTPFIGLGGSVEVSGRKNFAFDQWAVWLKGGFGFM